jgi:hypothetical protein|tara:strand:+ start:97 stop:930 length:834 start_codon:yes stop_codon:yes gene_type:complete
MFIYKEWEIFCSKIKKLGIKSVTAFEALEYSKSKENYVIIKHDVETNAKKALKLAIIENKYDLKATYYVQSYLIENEDNIKILKKISRLGHEVTYHYDVLDSNNGNFSNAEIEFDETLIKFENLGMKVKTVCPHGNPVKKRSGWSSNKDFFRNKFINSKYFEIVDIVINPEKFINNELIYISDAGFGWKKITDISNNDHSQSKDEKLKNLNSVVNLIQDRSKTIIISAHPHRWGKFKATAFLHRTIFFTLRITVRILTKVSFFKKIISKFYYLAKKI